MRGSAGRGRSGATLLEMLIALAILASATVVVGRALTGVLAAEQRHRIAGETVWMVHALAVSRRLEQAGIPYEPRTELGRPWRAEPIAAPPGAEPRWALRYGEDDRTALILHLGFPD